MLWIVLGLAALAAVGMFFVPAFIIRPFAHQNPRALEWAMAIRQRAPAVAPICALAALLVAAWLWPASGRWRKALLIVVGFFAAFSGVMSHLNYFEWMFHPVPSAAFEAESASKLEASELIMAVRFGSDARAYPIREMAYHHILNDVVEGVPIAVTY